MAALFLVVITAADAAINPGNLSVLQDMLRSLTNVADLCAAWPHISCDCDCDSRVNNALSDPIPPTFNTSGKGGEEAVEGYSLHKLDLKANSGDGERNDDDDDDPSPRRLPEPLLRLGFRTLGSWPHISALGSKIVFMGQRHADQFRVDGDDDDDKRRRLILVYDTATAAVDVSHHLPDDMHLVTSYDAVAAGKDRLYLLLPQFVRSPEPPRRPRPEVPARGVDMAPYPYVEKVERVKAGTTLYLMLPDPFDRRSPEPFRPPATDRVAVGMPYLEKVEKVYLEENTKKSAAHGCRRLYGDDDGDEKEYELTLHRNRLTERWSWRTGPSPPPFSGGRRVTGHALHPDGRTIFVSVEKTHAGRPPVGEEGTFSYDTERAEWTRRGDWRLPFKGQAHYDPHLDAWVGIAASSAGHPRLVACDVVQLSTDADGTAPPPKWTKCEEKLTFLGALRKRRVGDPKLVSMGGGEFCVVESAQRPGFKLGLGSLGDGDKFELRVTVFHAKFGKNGELLMTTAAAAAAGSSGPWRSHTYVLSRYLLNFHAPAFWM
uniref:Uncharacterized protein n=1 Tax=Oryza punctata TaxID=4537 RepID=A0A0E0KQK4_ORYPU